MHSAAAPIAPTAAAAPTGTRPLPQRAWLALEHAVDALTGAPANPLRHLGAIGFLLFFLLALSGIYLYALIDTSAQGAYQSIERLSHLPWWQGGVLRSLHRYAADAFIVVMLVHLLREALFGRFRGVRRFTWLTGVPLIAFAFVSAVGGFWLHWDRLGQFSALATAEWLDHLPLFASPFTRNFIGSAMVSDRLFSLLVFVHIGVPLLLLFGLWFHIQRLSRAEVFPPRPVALGATLALLLLSLLWPVASQGAADLARAPDLLSMDWLLLAVHPLMYASSAGAVWTLVGSAALLLFALPFLPLPAKRRVPVAVVDPPNCNGCRRCFADCPFAAITMVPHPNRRIGRQMATVDADLCASCGICVGACPSSTPFRSVAELVTGIDMPSAPLTAVRQRLHAGLAATPPGTHIVAFGCERGAAVQTLAAPDVLPIPLMCTGALPPSFVEYALRDGAAGVLVTGCRDGGCEYRLGARWTDERLAGAREPHLRASVPRERIATVAADAGEDGRLRQALDVLRARLRTLPPARPDTPPRATPPDTPPAAPLPAPAASAPPT